MIIKEHKPNWFIGRHRNLVFFGRTKYEVQRKYHAHMNAQAYRIADKLIALDAEYRRAKT